MAKRTKRLSLLAEKGKLPQTTERCEKVATASEAKFEIMGHFIGSFPLLYKTTC
jgi:hypothetical protein